MVNRSPRTFMQFTPFLVVYGLLILVQSQTKWPTWADVTMLVMSLSVARSTLNSCNSHQNNSCVSLKSWWIQKFLCDFHDLITLILVSYEISISLMFSDTIKYFKTGLILKQN